MASLREMHKVALSELKKRLTLNPVSLKYPLPERPAKTLGLLKVDGEVYSSEKFSRIVLLRINLPVYLSAYSTLFRPRIEYDLPFFTCETAFTGKKRLFVMDIHRTEKGERHEDSTLLDRLMKIRGKYPDLLEKSTTTKGKIQSLHSKAVCHLKITKEQDDDTLNIFSEYLGVFSDMVEKATPLTGDVLDRAEQAFEGYLNIMVDNDPGVRVNRILFGKKGGLTRMMDIYFGR